MKSGRKYSSSLINTAAIATDTRPGKSRPNSTVLPNAARICATRATAASTARDESMMPISSQPLSLKWVKPASTRCRMPSITSAQRSPPTHPPMRIPAPPAPAVGGPPVAPQAAEQLVYRDAERLALDVPQGLIDAGDGAHEDRSATVKARTVHHLPEVIDACRVLPDQVRLQFMHCRLNGARMAFDHRFAPADEALVRLDAQEHPTRRHPVGRQLRDFHRGSSRKA